MGAAVALSGGRAITPVGVLHHTPIGRKTSVSSPRTDQQHPARGEHRLPRIRQWIQLTFLYCQPC